MSMNRKAMIDALEQLLRVQLDGHQRLLRCLEAKREAIRTAQVGRIGEIVEKERRIVLRIAEAERSRIELMRRIAPNNATLAEITEQAEEPAKTRLIALAAELRDAVEDVQRRSSIIRAATEALANHMTGVMRTVHSALSRAGVYGRRGEMNTGAQLDFNVDVKS